MAQSWNVLNIASITPIKTGIAISISIVSLFIVAICSLWLIIKTDSIGHNVWFIGHAIGFTRSVSDIVLTCLVCVA